MRTTIIYATITLITCCSWIHQKTSGLEMAGWLIGTWENRTPRGMVYETWTRLSEKEFFGRSYIKKDEDTLVFESIRLIQEPKGLFYIPTIRNQNDGLPVRFQLKSVSDSTLVFENQQHDFPQVISYTRVSADSLVAEISGVIDGLSRRQAFHMKRSN